MKVKKLYITTDLLWEDKEVLYRAKTYLTIISIRRCEGDSDKRE